MSERYGFSAYLWVFFMMGIVWMTGCEQSGDTETARWKEMNTWPVAERKVAIQSDILEVLYKDVELKNMIYAADGAIWFEQAKLEGEVAPKRLIDVQATEAYYYRNGETMLIGIPIHQDNPENYHRGDWYAVSLGVENPVITKLEGNSNDPRETLTVTMTEKPWLFIFSVGEQDGRFSEYAYHSGDSGFLPINVETGAGGDAGYEAYAKMRPKLEAEPIRFKREMPLENKDGWSASAYEDERGTIAVMTQSGKLTGAIRYPSHKLESFIWKRDLLGKSQPFALLRYENGENIAAFPFAGGASVLEAEPELFEEEWRMIDPLNFYKAYEDSIKTIHYTSPESGRVYYANHRSFSVSEAKLSDENSGLLTYINKDGNLNHLSTFDLIHGHDLLEQAWMKDSLPIEQSDLKRSVEEWQQLSDQSIPQAVLDSLWHTEEIQAEVMRIIENLQDPCIYCGPDYAPQIQVRSISSVWHVLYGKELYRLEDKKLKKLGNLPIQGHVTIGEGANGYTAQDYTYSGGYWYVSDTFADRLLKLDDKFDTVAELPLPSPTHIMLLEDGLIEVESLKGSTVLRSDNLMVVRGTKSKKESIKSTASSEQQVESISLYKDPETGNIWLTAGEGSIGIYHPQSRTLTKHFVGYSESGYSRIKLLPYQGDMLVLLDHRLERLNADGTWQQTIKFPETSDKYSCYGWRAGENSHVFDESGGRIYLVHDCGIIGIDIDNGISSVMFSQNDSNIGRIALVQDKVVFSMEGRDAMGNYEPLYPHSNELVTISVNSGAVQRYRLEKGWFSDRMIDSGQLLLWSFKDLSNRSMENVQTAVVNLDL